MAVLDKATGQSRLGLVSRGWFEKSSDTGSCGTTFPLVIPAPNARGAGTCSAASCLSGAMFNSPDASDHEDFVQSS